MKPTAAACPVASITSLAYKGNIVMVIAFYAARFKNSYSKAKMRKYSFGKF